MIKYLKQSLKLIKKIQFYLVIQKKLGLMVVPFRLLQIILINHFTSIIIMEVNM